MATYGDYLKELERIADNDKREHTVKLQNKIKQLNSELAKFENEKEPLRVELAELRQENDNLSKELNRRDEYSRLVPLKNKASTEEEYQDLASRFRSMGSYKDSAKLASECDEQCRVLKEKRLEREAAEKLRLEQEEKDRKVKQMLEHEEKLRLEREEKDRKARAEVLLYIGSSLLGGVIGGLLFVFLTPLVDGFGSGLVILLTLVGIPIILGDKMKLDLMEFLGGTPVIIGWGVIIAAIIGVSLPEIRLVASIVIGGIIGAGSGAYIVWQVRHRR